MTDSLHRVDARAGSLWLTRHAVERYVERVKPLMTFEQACAELQRFLAGVVVEHEKPLWANEHAEATGWAHLSDGIAFPVVGSRLVTCMNRRGVGAQLRVVRQEQRKRTDVDGFRRKHKKRHGKVARGERRRAQARREAQSDE